VWSLEVVKMALARLDYVKASRYLPGDDIECVFVSFIGEWLALF
jgi:hypothetical protein